MLCTIELMLAGICINIPMLRPFYLRWRQKSKISQSGSRSEGPSSMFNSSKSRYLATARSKSHKDNTWIELVRAGAPVNPMHPAYNDTASRSCHCVQGMGRELTRDRTSRKRAATKTTAVPRGSLHRIPTRSTCRPTFPLPIPDKYRIRNTIRYPLANAVPESVRKTLTPGHFLGETSCLRLCNFQLSGYSLPHMFILAAGRRDNMNLRIMEAFFILFSERDFRKFLNSDSP